MVFENKNRRLVVDDWTQTCFGMLNQDFAPFFIETHWYEPMNATLKENYKFTIQSFKQALKKKKTMPILKMDLTMFNKVKHLCRVVECDQQWQIENPIHQREKYNK